MVRQWVLFVWMLSACGGDDKGVELGVGAPADTGPMAEDGSTGETGEPSTAPEDTGGEAVSSEETGDVTTEPTDTGDAETGHEDTGESGTTTTDTDDPDTETVLTDTGGESSEGGDEDADDTDEDDSVALDSGVHDVDESDEDDPALDPEEEEEAESAFDECEVLFEPGEDLACGAMSLGHDRWMINVTEDMVGEVLSVMVDTFRHETAFDPKLLLLSPEGCIFEWADDDVECTYPPPTFLCPAMSVVLNQPGVWKLAVLAHPTCEDSTSPVEYLLKVGGISTLPVLIDDDLHETMPFCVRPEVEHGEECWAD